MGWKRCTNSLIVWCIKHSIILHNCSYNIVKDAWNVLANLYYTHNEASFAYLCKKLTNTILTKIKDLNYKLAFASDTIASGSLVQIVLDGLLDYYWNLASMLRIMMKRNLNSVKFDKLIIITLKEYKSKKKKTRIYLQNHAFVAKSKRQIKSTTTKLHL